MRRQPRTARLLVALAAMTSCSRATSGVAEGVHVQAQQDVTLSDNPLGDVEVGDVEEGEVVTALCFVSRAQTSGGFFGSAIRVTAGDLAAYAPVTDFPLDSSDRQPIFDLDAHTLRERLPACSQ